MAPRLRRNGTVLPPRRSLRIKEMKMKSAPQTETQVLPHELILEILCFLPPKPIVRFKCVSKLWRESIEDHSFTHKHSRKKIERQRLHILKGNKVITQRNEEHFEFLCGANGLILERSKHASKFRVRNPLTKHILHLLDPMEDSLYSIMVYAHDKKKYKLFCHYEKVMCRGFKILTLETDNAWRNVDIPELSVGVNEKHWLLNGSLLLVLTGDYQKIVCTDIESERFSIIDNIPKAFITSTGSVSVNSWDNNYSISRMDRNGAGEWKIDVWILEDYKEHIWAQRKTSFDLCFINKFFPEATEIKFLVFKDNILWLSLGTDKRILGYNIVKKILWLTLNTDVCKRIIYSYYPNLVYLKGMKAEDRDISDYEIFPFPHC